MTRRQRNLHAWLFPILAVVLLIALAIALEVRP
jgi:hypothetical protein